MAFDLNLANFRLMNLPSGLEFYDQVNFMKSGLAFADALSTVSPTYAREIQTQAYGCMLEGMLRARAHDLHGILNGIDVHEWDPRADPHLQLAVEDRVAERRLVRRVSRRTAG